MIKVVDPLEFELRETASGVTAMSTAQIQLSRAGFCHLVCKRSSQNGHDFAERGLLGVSELDVTTYCVNKDWIPDASTSLLESIHGVGFGLARMEPRLCL